MFSLTIGSLIQQAQRNHADAEIVSVTNDNDLHVYSCGEMFNRCHKLANGLSALGFEQGRIAGTLAWNDHRHLEIFYTLAAMGGVTHSIHPNSNIEQIEYEINHTEDQWIFVDPTFLPLLESLADKLLHVQHYIILTERKHMPASSLPNILCYEEIIHGQHDSYEWPSIDENSNCSLCYTAGTTGVPKGVLQSHRASVLQSLASCLPDALNLSCRDVVMPVSPMLHIGGMKTPYLSALVGFKMVLPGARAADCGALQKLIQDECVTFATGDAQLWSRFLNYLGEVGREVDSLASVAVVGPSFSSNKMAEFEHRYGVDTYTSWCVTELGSIGTYNRLKHDRRLYHEVEFSEKRARTGRPINGVELKITDERNVVVQNNGIARGILKIRSPWLAEAYFKEDVREISESGWFDTGDLATIDEEGNMQIVGRVEDVIGLDGDFINLIDLENISIDHFAVAEAAAIVVSNLRSKEYTIIFLVLHAGESLSKTNFMNYLEGRLPKISLPRHVLFVGGLPRNSRGMVKKKKLIKNIVEPKFQTVH